MTTKNWKKRGCITFASAFLLNANASFGQALPGPGAEGWYVVTGQPTTTFEEMERIQFPREMKTFYDNTCIAYLLGKSDADDAISNSKPLPFSVRIVPRQKFGPYPTPDQAYAALRQAGWQRNDSWQAWAITQACP